MQNAMVIDDSSAMRIILSKALGKLGYEVCSANNGRTALEYLNERKPDLSLILVDWNMPEMNGLDFVRSARAIPRYGSVPLMMVTTETEVDQMVLALEAGANEYLMKPFTQDAIVSKLRVMGVLQ